VSATSEYGRPGIARRRGAEEADSTREDPPVSQTLPPPEREGGHPKTDNKKMEIGVVSSAVVLTKTGGWVGANVMPPNKGLPPWETVVKKLTKDGSP